MFKLIFILTFLCSGLMTFADFITLGNITPLQSTIKAFTLIFDIVIAFFVICLGLLYSAFHILIGLI